MQRPIRVKPGITAGRKLTVTRRNGTLLEEKCKKTFLSTTSTTSKTGLSIWHLRFSQTDAVLSAGGGRNAYETRRPNLFLVGAQKSGTTTLALMLDQHRKDQHEPTKGTWLTGVLAQRAIRARRDYGGVAMSAGILGGPATEQAYLALFEAHLENASFLGEPAPGICRSLHARAAA